MLLDFTRAFFPDDLEEQLKENSERSVSSVSELSAEDLAEAERIARELVKLRDAGAISSDPRDPEAAFYARLLRDFSAEFNGKRNPKNPKTDL